MQIVLDKAGNFVREESILADYGRIRTILQDQDMLYILTNNTSVRGKPKEEDDQLIKILIK